MYRLDQPEFLYALALVPLLIVVYAMYRIWQRRAQKAFGDTALLEQLAPEKSRTKSALKFIIALVALTALIIALVNPKIGSKLETVKREGVDIVFALDVSKSMLAQDARPDRLTKAKQIIARTLDNLVSDRVGMIIYAGQAFPQLPITTDYSAARLFLKGVDTDLISSQGTAISSAIDLASRYYDDEDQKNRILVIISDGEDHEEGIDAALKQAEENGITIYTIGLGTEQGAPIPGIRKGYNVGYKKDNAGEIVVSRRNSELLKSIAEQGGGKFLAGKSVKSIVDELMDEVAAMEKKEFEAQVFSDYEDQFQWFLGLALLLLVLDTLILDRKTQWFKKLNLFEKDEK